MSEPKKTTQRDKWVLTASDYKGKMLLTLRKNPTHKTDDRIYPYVIEDIPKLKEALDTICTKS